MKPHKYLKNIRKKIGWTQKEMGEFLGFTHTTIAAWENQRSRIPLVVIRCLEIIEIACQDDLGRLPVALVVDIGLKAWFIEGAFIEDL